MQENERLRVRLAEMQSHPSPLEAATAKRDEHMQDQEKFRKLIDSLQVSCLQLRSTQQLIVKENCMLKMPFTIYTYYTCVGREAKTQFHASAALKVLS